jgi:hypothetical protein
MAEIDDWAAATYITVKNGANRAQSIRAMLDSNTDFPGLKTAVEELRDVMLAVEAVPVVVP